MDIRVQKIMPTQSMDPEVHALQARHFLSFVTGEAVHVAEATDQPNAMAQAEGRRSVPAMPLCTYTVS